MKKYSLMLILVLVLFVITGGTYAAWKYYTEAVANKATEGVGPTIDIQEQSLGAKGTIEAGSANLAFEITDAGNYVPTLTGSGSATFTFNDVDPQDGYTFNGFKWWISVEGATSSDVFASINTSEQDSGNTNISITVNGTDIAALLTLKSEKLPTKADAEALQGKLSGLTITLHVGEKAA